MGLMRVWATCNMNVGDKVAFANIVALGLVVARRAPVFQLFRVNFMNFGMVSALCKPAKIRQILNPPL